MNMPGFTAEVCFEAETEDPTGYCETGFVPEAASEGVIVPA